MSVAYKETIKKERWGYKELVRHYENGDIEELCTQFDQLRQCDKVLNRTVKHPDGSEEGYDQWDNLEHQILSDGTTLGYNKGILHTKYFPDGSVQNFHDNGQVSTYKNADRTLFIHYDKEGNITLKADYQQKHFIVYASPDEIKYEFSPQKTYINLKHVKLFKLGIKDRNKENHWVEDTTLSPHKKTVIFFGGDATWGPKEANGYLDSVIDIFGISEEQLRDIQLVSGYRQKCRDIIANYTNETGVDFDYDGFQHQVYKQEILLKLMPFMAQNYNGAWERILPQQLCSNFRNIMLMSHCYGAKDICIMADVLKQTMTKLGYSREIQKKALQQVVCITNNTQREFNDNTGFTVYHRYSVSDGQGRKQYDKQYSADYPIFLESYAPFHNRKKSLAAFVSVNKNELLMVFNRVISRNFTEDEHNCAFWTIDKKMLTAVGKMQADLIRSLGQYWLNNHAEIKNAVEFLKQSVQSIKLRQKTSAALIAGNRLRRLKINPLHNPAIIETAYLKYKHTGLPPEEHGAWKLLSEEAKSDKPTQEPSGLFVELSKILSR